MLKQFYKVTPHLFQQAIENCSLALLCNINFNRPFLQQTKQAGKVIATDVHTIADLDDEYNADFMAAADILFMSDEKLPVSPEAWVRRVQNQQLNTLWEKAHKNNPVPVFTDAPCEQPRAILQKSDVNK